MSLCQQSVSAYARLGPGHIGHPPQKDKEGNALNYFEIEKENTPKSL